MPLSGIEKIMPDKPIKKRQKTVPIDIGFFLTSY